MKRTSQMLGTVSAFALAVSPTLAMAAPGTTQGTDILNTVSVSYSVGGVAQTAISASDTFKVDRKIDVAVTAQDAAATSVSPGATGSTTLKLTYLVTNNTNDITDFLLTAAQSGTSTAFGGSDNFDVTNVKIYIDSNNDGAFTAADTQASSIYRLAAGAAVRVFITADVPISQVDGDIASVLLTAQAASGVTQTSGLAGTGGTALTQSAGANVKGTVENVFADAADASGDAANNGQAAARNDYKVAAAKLTVAKYSFVYSDPVNGISANAKAIPGAVVEYCIVVKNGAGAASATGVNVSDVVPSNLTYVASSVWLGGTFNNTDRCDTATGAAGSDAANYTAGTKTVANNFGTMAASTTNTLRFRATIN